MNGDVSEQLNFVQGQLAVLRAVLAATILSQRSDVRQTILTAMNEGISETREELGDVSAAYREGAEYTTKSILEAFREQDISV